MTTEPTPIPAHELHEALAQAHNDLYKQVHGIRPRWVHYEGMTTPELEREVLSLMAGAERAAEEWAEEDARRERAVAEEAQAAVLETERKHRERWMDRAVAAGAAGW